MTGWFRQSLPIRRLIATSLYLFSAAMFITNLAYTNAAGFDAVDLGLTITGVVSWVAGGAHSLYRRILGLKSEPPAPIIRSSTHSMINAALFSASAIFFIAGDAYNDRTQAEIRALRLAGSIMWLLSSSTYGWLAVAHERKQEDNADVTVKPCGIHADIYTFTCEALYLAAGVMYAAAIYRAIPIPAFKAAGNAGWLVASSHETGRTFTDMVTTKPEDEPGPMGLRL